MNTKVVTCVAVKSNNELTKWIAVVMCLALLCLAMMPTAINGIGIYLLLHNKPIEGLLAIANGLIGLGGLLIGIETVEEITALVIVGACLGAIGVGLLLG